MAKAIGLGTTLGLSTVTTGTPTYANIGYIRSIEGPSAESDEVESTTLDTTGNYREFVQTLIDPGEISFDLVWDPTTDTTGLMHHELATYLGTREKLMWHMVLPTTTQFVNFTGWVRSFQPSIPVDDLMTASVTVRITSGITWPTS